MEAGVNLGRSSAYRSLLRRGYRTDFQEVAMHRPDSSAYSCAPVHEAIRERRWMPASWRVRFAAAAIASAPGESP